MATGSDTEKTEGGDGSGKAAARPPTASERAKAFLASQGRTDVPAAETDGGASAPEGAGPAQAGSGDRRGEVSAATIGRMLGLVSTSDLVVLEKKIDLLATRVNSIVAKLESMASGVAELPSGADFERVEVQLQTLRGAIKEALGKLSPGGGEDAQALAKSKVVSNQPQIFGGKVITRIQPKEKPEDPGDL